MAGPPPPPPAPPKPQGNGAAPASAPPVPQPVPQPNASPGAVAVVAAPQPTPNAVQSVLSSVMIPQSTGGSTVRIQPIATHKMGRHLNALVYGAPGVGKTFMAGGAPGPVVFFDIDKGTLSVREKENVFVIDVNSLSDTMAGIKIVAEQLASTPGSIGTIVFDNLTEFQAFLQRDLFDRRGGQGVLQTQDWGTMLLQMESIISFMKGLPCHKIWIAHEMIREGHCRPYLQGQMADKLPGKFDLIFRFFVQVQQPQGGDPGAQASVFRGLVTNPTEQIVAKDRSGKLARVEPADINLIIRKIFGN